MEASGSGSRSSRRLQEPIVMEFHPTYEQFKDFNSYIELIETFGAHRGGFAKIIPPSQWKPRRTGYDMEDIDTTIPAPVLQKVQGQDGLYSMNGIVRKSMTVKHFREMALSDTYKTPVHTRHYDLEKLYWSGIKDSPPVCYSNVAGSLMDDELTEWNLDALGSILDAGIEVTDDEVGINTARLSFGMFKTSVPWSLEEMDLYSISYLHFGAPRTWYSIPPKHGLRFENLVHETFPNTSKKCPAFLRHQNILISPQVLKHHKIPYNKVIQKAGEFVITFPYSYHAAFDTGFNCIESTNFATTRWIDYGKRMHNCFCGRDDTKVDLSVLVETFQPERYVRWLMGREEIRHPEYPSIIESWEWCPRQQTVPSGLQPRRRRIVNLPYDPAALQEELNSVVESEVFQENRSVPERFEDFETDSEANSQENQDMMDVLRMIVEEESEVWPSEPETYLVNGVLWVEIHCISLYEVHDGFPDNIDVNLDDILVLYEVNDPGDADDALQ